MKNELTMSPAGAVYAHSPLSDAGAVYAATHSNALFVDRERLFHSRHSFYPHTVGTCKITKQLSVSFFH